MKKNVGRKEIKICKELGKNSVIIKTVRRNQNRKKNGEKEEIMERLMKRLNDSVPHFKFCHSANPGSFFMNVNLENIISHEALPRKGCSGVARSAVKETKLYDKTHIFKLFSYTLLFSFTMFPQMMVN